MIVIPDKLTAWAAAGILYLVVQFLLWLSTVTGIDFTGFDGTALAVAIATLLAMVIKALLEKFVPEAWHVYINSFLEWLSTIVVAGFLFKALK